jgi:plastocyanin
MNGSRWVRAVVAIGAVLTIAVLAGCASTSSGVSPAGTTPMKAKMPIRLDPVQGPVDRTVTVSRKAEEVVWWHNDDDRGHTVRFTDWPFRESQQDIFVEPGQDSRRFHVYKKQEPGTYTYTVKPSVGDKDGPPDPPAVVVSD